ncbi:MAG: ComEC/Rec2 family competence protein, partial [Planctomycetes bacterium]|nr:ComEC/Rec2 family competence protein [Planctomycetota bacterium]
AVAAVGAVHVRLAFGTVGPDHIATFTPQRSILATVRGHVITAPKVFKSSSVPGYPRPARTNFILRADSISADGRWRTASGLVRVTIDSPAVNLVAGQQVELVGRLSRFKGPDNPGQMDWSRFARRTRVFVQMSIPAASGATVIDDAALSWVRKALWHLRASARQHLLACGDADHGHLLGALILGERDPALRSLNETMARAGIAHFLSISGLHLAVFLGFVYFLCGIVQFTPRRAAVVVLIVLGGYLLLAEPRAPLLRSAIMAAALCISVIAHRRYASLNALAAAAIVLLAIDPLQILAPGFQLSFAIVAGLIVLHRPLRGFMFGRWLSRRGLMVFRDDQRVRRWMWFSLGNASTGMATVCLAAYLMAAPLVAFHFGLFSPYAPVLSVLVFPLVLAVLVPGYIAIALAWPMPNLAHSIQQVALGAADVLAGAVRAAEQLPFLCFHLRPVSAVWTLLCYATIATFCLARRFRFGRTVAAVMLVATVALGAYTQRAAPPPAPGTAQLDLLDVGAGQCALLRTPSGGTWLIDAGTQGGYDAWTQVLRPFLRERRLPRPTGAFISHANTDHYNGLIGLLGSSTIERVYLNDYFGRAKPLPKSEGDMIDMLVDHRSEIIRLRSGSKVQLDGDTLVEVLWPPAAQAPDLTVNDTSLVLRVTCGGKRILFPGDLSREGQRRLLADGADLSADIPTPPHPGGGPNPHRNFSGAVSPDVALLGAPGGLATPPHAPPPPPKHSINKLRHHKQYYTTPKHGWIHLAFGKEGTIRAETMHADR